MTEQATLLVVLACGLDRLAGDPQGCPHPVQVMGGVIVHLRRLAEAWAGDQQRKLTLAGGLITLVVVSGSGLAGWGVEQLALRWPALGLPLLLLGLASALAGRSLDQAVGRVLRALPDLPRARRRLAWIVGRDVDDLDGAGILRAAAETAAENAVDGLFAPLFWMLIGAALWERWPGTAGPLAMGWIFKASSTLDSMLGYRRGRLRWLGTAGARLDDLLTWLPCRLVALTLPMAAGRGQHTLSLFRLALREGRADPSPNAGVSQAIFAHLGRVELGGANRYGGEWKRKPLVGAGFPTPDQQGVERILRLAACLEGVWIVLALGLARIAQ